MAHAAGIGQSEYEAIGNTTFCWSGPSDQKLLVCARERMLAVHRMTLTVARIEQRSLNFIRLDLFEFLHQTLPAKL